MVGLLGGQGIIKRCTIGIKLYVYSLHKNDLEFMISQLVESRDSIWY